MDKEKLIKAALWLSAFSLSIFLSATFLFAGFHNMKLGNYTLLIIGLLLIPAIYFFAYKGFSLILEAIFEK